MMRHCSLLTVTLILVLSSLSISAQNITDTRLLWQPAISKNSIAFIYAEDLWVANLDGSYPRRLTISEGSESNPVFSPDGREVGVRIDLNVSSLKDGYARADCVERQHVAPVWRTRFNRVRDGHSPRGVAITSGSDRLTQSW